MKCDILTLFPDMVEAVLSASILGRAREKGLLDVRAVNLRAYAEGRHKVADDYPYGGGVGMVLKPEPVFRAVEDLRARHGDVRLVLMTPQGRTLTQAVAAEFARRKPGSGDGRFSETGQRRRARRLRRILRNETAPTSATTVLHQSGRVICGRRPDWPHDAHALKRQGGPDAAGRQSTLFFS